MHSSLTVADHWIRDDGVRRAAEVAATQGADRRAGGKLGMTRRGAGNEKPIASQSPPTTAIVEMLELDRAARQTESLP